LPSIRTSGDNLTVHITAKDRYGITLLFATGSREHIEALGIVAESKGCTLDENGVRKKNRIFAAKSEEDITTLSACRSSRRNCARPARKCRWRSNTDCLPS
jgi:DNA polymerase/3'-5' exonuclease PolX